MVRPPGSLREMPRPDGVSNIASIGNSNSFFHWPRAPIPCHDIVHCVVNHGGPSREYASQELAAFCLSWLYALPSPVINRATPQGLAGQWRHRSEWLWLAAHAGLPTSLYRTTSEAPRDEQDGSGRLVPPDTPVQTVFVVADQVVGAWR